jgi:S1-C subfamily serine protease
MKLASVSGERKETIDGLSVAELNQSTRLKYKIPGEIEYGVVITGIEESSSASAAGLQEGDVIREINKKTIESAEMFKKEFKNSKETVLLYVYRNGNHIFKVLKKR